MTGEGEVVTMPAVGSDEQFGYGLRLVLAGLRAEAAGFRAGESS